jgi:hypothetical protein
LGFSVSLKSTYNTTLTEKQRISNMIYLMIVIRSVIGTTNIFNAKVPTPHCHESRLIFYQPLPKVSENSFTIFYYSEVKVDNGKEI